jgi:uncharacterized membrane protein
MNQGEISMNISEITTWIGTILFALYFLNQLYITLQALRWRSQDKLIARALERHDD